MDSVLDQKLKNLTPEYQEIEKFEDADEEMKFIANHIKKTSSHNADIEPDRIKFLYSNKPKKVGESFYIFELFKRSDMDKMVNDEYDFIITVFYEAWKKLTSEQKLIMADKAFCGIAIDLEKDKLSKRPTDSNEYRSNMRQYGADLVMETSEIVDNVCQIIMEERAEAKKNAALDKKGKRKTPQHVED